MFKAIRLLVLTLLVLGSVGLAFMPSNTAAAQTTCARTHTVKAGENLFRIGLAYGVQWPTLMQWNGLTNSNLIYAGQVLCVSGPNPTPPPATGGPVVVYPGNPFGPTTEPRAYFPQVTLGQKFQLRGYNFPANRQVTISLATLGSAAYVPYYTASTDASGNFFVEVIIPDTLKTSGTVAVDVRTASGYYARNWFYNR